MLERFETTTCGRCGGSGRYSYCLMYGSVCFGCGGSGKKYTKRGAAALAYLKEIRSKRADQFTVGELFYVEPGPFNPGAFAIIDSIGIDSDGLLDIKMSRAGKPFMSYGRLRPDSLHRPGLTAEQKADTLKRALEYQDTLTKQGKPRREHGRRSITENNERVLLPQA